jgi:hypothetical protein
MFFRFFVYGIKKLMSLINTRFLTKGSKRLVVFGFKPAEAWCLFPVSD